MHIRWFGLFTKQEREQMGRVNIGDFMFKKILLPTDGSALSKKAIRKGVAFAKSIGAKVVGFHAKPLANFVYHGESMAVVPGLLEAQQAGIDRAAQKFIAEIDKVARKEGVPCECLSVENNSPYEAIIGAAKNKGCDLIVMASHGRRGLAGLVLGSEANKVLTHSKIPVLVMR
jgi:nucleotide-binding universal stress UspA family protein